jgi:serine/threonine protein kinase
LRRKGAGTSPSSPSYAPGHAHSYSHASANSHLSVSPPNLSPLHQSPSLAPQWVPPTPPATDDVQLRLLPEPSYLLGEGRYATVYLAAYKKPPTSPPSLSPTRANGEGAGWKLCAAKRLAPDRESQTMGLREAFFLNRLGAGKGRGQVHVVRLIAVKDDTAGAPGAESPSTYVQVINESRALQREVAAMNVDSPPRRHRASTIYAGGRGADPEAPGREAAIGAGPGPSVPAPSRLVLLVEHAPLGTLDRLLRSSPGLVGPQLWGRWAREAASALEWVHGKGVVHADVKPSNLLVSTLRTISGSPSGLVTDTQLTSDLHLRLSDFGSSLLIHPEHPPTDGVGLGTLPFSPPELVDPAAPFSFPVDIFALGATLYQCLTGREPYRGARPVEMMHYVRNGGLWQWLERDRLARVGTEGFFSSAAASPYPSAWRADPLPGAEVRRGGSLRVPHGHGHTASLSVDIPSTPLRRVGSAESIVASTDAGRSAEDSPAGVRLWAAWHHGRHNAVDRLLSDSPASPPRSPVSRASSLRSPLRHVHGPDTNAQPDVVPALSPSSCA